MSAVTTLSRADLTVEPGSKAVVTVRIRSAASIVDRFDVDVVGPTSDWAQLAPASLSLFPGAEGLVEVTFMPPRASTPRAGVYPFAIRVRPAADPSKLSVEEGKLTVTPFTAVSAEIAPQTSRGARAVHHVVTVENGGNAPSEVVVTASDPDRHLNLSVDPPRAVVKPADRTEFRVRVEAGPFAFGAVRSWPFSLSVVPGRQSPIQLRATMNQRPLLMGRFPTLGALAAAGVALVAVAFLTGIGPFAQTAPSTPGLIGQVSAAPSAGVESQAPPSSAPSSSPPSVAPPSSEPSSSPSPTPPVALDEIDIAVTGDNNELGTNLELRCKEGEACREDVKQTVRSIAGELLNPYTGDGIRTTTSVSRDGSLPVVIIADRPFPWSTADQAREGETERVVIDLGPMLGWPEPNVVYAVVDTADGAPARRFVVDPEAAQSLFEDLYQVVDADPLVAATPDPAAGGGDVAGAWQWNPNLDWVNLLPAMSLSP